MQTHEMPLEAGLKRTLARRISDEARSVIRQSSKPNSSRRRRLALEREVKATKRPSKPK